MEREKSRSHIRWVRCLFEDICRTSYLKFFYLSLLFSLSSSTSLHLPPSILLSLSLSLTLSLPPSLKRRNQIIFYIYRLSFLQKSHNDAQRSMSAFSGPVINLDMFSMISAELKLLYSNLMYSQ